MRSSFSAQPKYPLARKGSFYLSERQSGNGVLFGVLFNMALFDFLKDKKSEAAGAQPAELNTYTGADYASSDHTGT